VILVAALVFFFGLLLHPSWVLFNEYSDLPTYHIPQLQYLVSSWQQTGEQPLWCPYSFAGMPFVHDIQVGAFYPPNLILYYLPAAMTGPALSWLVVAHMIVAGCTMLIYARSQGLNPICATLTALGYMFSGKWLLHIVLAGQYVMIGLAWLPLAVFLLEPALTGGRLRFAAWAGAVFALVVLGSHPQLTFFAGLFLAAWTLPVALEMTGSLGYRSSTTRTIAVGLGRWLWAVGSCFLVAASLAAVQLLPTLEAGRHTTRGARGMPAEISSELLSNIFGLVGPAPESLPFVGWENRTGLTVFWIVTALFAPTLARGTARLRHQTAICLGLVVFGLGGAFVFHSLPGFRLFRYPARMFLVASLPITLLVGAATQAMFDRLRSEAGLRLRMGRCLVLILSVGLVSTGTLCWLHGSPYGPSLRAYWGSLLATVPIAYWLVWSVASAGNRWPRWTAPRFQLAWGALLLIDLWAMEWPFVDIRPEASIYTPPSCVRYLIERGTRCQRVLDRQVPGHGEQSALGPVFPIIYRIEPVRGYNPIDIHRYKEYIQFISDRDEPVRPGNGILNFPVVNKSLLDLLAVRYLVQPSDLPAMDGEPGNVAHDQRWKMLSTDPAPEIHLFVPRGRVVLPPFSVYENREAFPQAFVVSRAEPLPDRSRVLGALKQADLRQVVFLEGLEPEARTRETSGPAGSATITTYEPNHVVVSVDCESPGYVVLSDPWYPGWTCTVDETPARLYRADYAFRAAAVSAGKHQVRFDFAPASYGRGKLLSGVSLAAIAVFGLAATVRHLLCRPRNTQPPRHIEPEHAPSEMTE
jgi:hypothetical protein